MGDDLHEQIYIHFSQRETQELLDILRSHNRDEWSEMTFGVIGDILRERGVEPSPQGEPAYEAHKSKSAAVREERQARHVVPAPRDAAVYEVHEPRGAMPSRPKMVTYAVYLAVGVLAIEVLLLTVNLITGQFSAFAAYPGAAPIFALLMVGFVVLEACLIYGTWLGRNGPRILYIGLVLFGIVSALTSGLRAAGFAQQPLRTGLSILTMCLNLVAVALLVLPVSNAWFRELRAARAVEQVTHRKKPRPQKSKASTWPVELSPDGWVRQYTFGTLAISFAVGLFASWLVYSLVLRLWGPNYPFDRFLNAMYAISCLPAQAVALVLGAVIGAISAGIPEARWRQATYGVWIAGLIAILLAIVGARVIPYWD